MRNTERVRLIINENNFDGRGLFLKYYLALQNEEASPILRILFSLMFNYVLQ